MSTALATHQQHDDELIDGLGVVRISEDAGRSSKGKLHADDSQIADIHRNAAARGVRVIEIVDETNVSGGTPLDQRPYGAAIARVEDPHDSVRAIVFAYRSRHDRSIVEGTQAIERMDAAGGLLVVGSSTLTHATPDKWAEATMGSFMSEWQKRQIAKASSDGVAEAVALGRVPYPSVGLGFVLNDDHTLRLADESTLAVVRDAFQLRADGASIESVRTFLRERGHARTYQSIRRMLLSRLYVGEIVFGGSAKPDGTITRQHVNLDPGFDAIVDRDVFDAVQAMRVPGGRYAKSERLLARQDVLHCGGCGGRMIAGATLSPNGKRHTYYRCGRQKENGCTAVAAIKAEAVEQYVVDEVKSILSDATVRESNVRAAIAARDAADKAGIVFKRARKRLAVDDEITDDDAAEQIAELRADLNAKLALAKELSADNSTVEMVNAMRDFDSLPLAAKRVLIKSALRSVDVRPGRGGSVDERCSIVPKRKASARLSS
jgi:recombinase-like zinc beta ribbon protein/resolvase-like protein/recombinase